MTEHQSPETIALRNQRSLNRLARAIAQSQGNFALILVRCNYVQLTAPLVQSLKELCPVEIRELHLPTTVKTLYSTIQAELGEEQPQALIVFGFNELAAIDAVLTSTNQVRNEFPQNFHFPLVLWVNDEVLQKLAQSASDFKSWAAVPIQFEMDASILEESIRQTLEARIDGVLNAGAGRFLDASVCDLPTNSLPSIELQFALEDLQRQGRSLPLELEAAAHFLIGWTADQQADSSKVQHYYQQSVALWQRAIATQVHLSDLGQAQYGGVLFHLGLWWRRYAVLHRSECMSACKTARSYYQDSLAQFRQSQRPDLEQRFINGLGEVLVRLEDWDALEATVSHAVSLHQAQHDSVRLAYSYGLLAEVALHAQDWSNAEHMAELALQVNDDSSISTHQQSWNREHNRNYYRLLLAEAQQHLNQPAAALNNLETAYRKSRPEAEPLLYVRILEQLRSLKFAQGEYLEAFALKQEQQLVEQHYGLRAFVGAGRLQVRQPLANLVPTAPNLSSPVTNLEIAASGRIQDIHRLVERVGRADHKLTIIYGQSGVGKSSLVQAGLMPALQQTLVEAREVLPLLVQVYSTWETVALVLSQGLQKRGTEPISPLNSLADFLAELQQNVDRHLVTVLIFDQFEEFFFVCKTLEARRPFFDFFQKCLNIPYVKVIFSLREDYLHYLLECNRAINLDVINNNILDKNILYYLGNFSPADAKSVINTLSKNSQFSLESDLINALIEDLSKETGMIRPIELQVIGAQLQADGITTLEQYQQTGGKPELIKHYLNQVVKSCGPENEQIAEFSLYFLTHENGTRPFKTQEDLISDLSLLQSDTDLKKLGLVLKILVNSGLVFLIPETSGDRYQLVHDYLAVMIRHYQSPKFEKLLAELETEKHHRQLSEARVNCLLKRQLFVARLGVVGMAIVAGVAALSVGISRTNTDVQSINGSIDALLEANLGFDAMLESLRAKKILDSWLGRWVPINTRRQTSILLLNSISNVREYNRLQGHSMGVRSVRFSPSGDRIASAGGMDGTIKLWSLDGQELQTLPGQQGTIWDVNFSPDGQTLVSSGDDIIKLWNRDGKPLKIFRVPPSPAQPGEDAVEQKSIYSVAFSPNGQTLATAHDDGTIKLWSRNGSLLKSLPNHICPVHRVVFSPNGKMLVSTGNDATVKQWNATNGQLIRTLSISKIVRRTRKECDPNDKDWLLNVAWSPQGDKIAAVGRDQKVYLWNANGQKLKEFPAHEDYILSVDFSPDGKTLMTGSADRSISLWQVATGKLVNTLKGHNGFVHSVQFSPNGKTLVSGSNDTTVRLWQMNPSSTLQSYQTLKGHQGTIRMIRFSPDGQRLIGAGEDKTIRLWQADGTLMGSLSGHDSEIRQVIFSPNGKWIASASDDKTVKLWSRDGALIRSFPHPEQVRTVQFTRNSQTLASASEDGIIRLWQLNGQLSGQFEGRHTQRIADLAFSPNGKWIASASWDNTVKLWTLEGKELHPLLGHKYYVERVQFSPDDTLLASASSDGTVKLWWTSTGQERKTFKGHGLAVTSVNFSPDGQTLASASRDGTIRLWRLDGTLLNTLRNFGPTWDVSFNPTGEALVSSSGGLLSVGKPSELRVWNLNLDQLSIQACGWLHDYLRHNPQAKSDRALCDDIPAQK
jgi:WD40 repeat protein